MANSDLNEVLNALFSMAEMLLKKEGEFYPIGVIMLTDGQIRHVGAKIEGNEHPPSQPLIDLLRGTFQEEARTGKLRAAGICYDVLTVPPGKQLKQDAIFGGLEHCLGEAVNVFKPYAKMDDGNVQLEEIFATRRTLQFFDQIPHA
jgi:hypothetical protein